MQRIEINLQTGVRKVIEISAEEQAQIIANQPILTQEQLDAIAFAKWKAEQEALKEAELRQQYELAKGQV